MIVCEKCGSTAVFQLIWKNYNTDEERSYDGACDHWCDHCEDCTTVTDFDEEIHYCPDCDTKFHGNDNVELINNETICHKCFHKREEK